MSSCLRGLRSRVDYLRFSGKFLRRDLRVLYSICNVFFSPLRVGTVDRLICIQLTKLSSLHAPAVATKLWKGRLLRGLGDVKLRLHHDAYLCDSCLRSHGVPSSQITAAAWYRCTRGPHWRLVQIRYLGLTSGGSAYFRQSLSSRWSSIRGTSDPNRITRTSSCTQGRLISFELAIPTVPLRPSTRRAILSWMPSSRNLSTSPATSTAPCATTAMRLGGNIRWTSTSSTRSSAHTAKRDS
ncbi:hypothetical protein OH76DRAFT_1258723 [Lentinus brumalis]|uniref:Uncharacterized protein n=1 Tax=Lentinus brumalis TaxID=2498619 RepID=A0A371CRE1_9APHY|nr:hypothetical protein OH76DRAFT_1258723 [Polyporus brumalis]